MESELQRLIRERIDAAYEGKQAAFARATGLAPAYISHLVNGKVEVPSADVRRILVRETGIDPIDLLVMVGELDGDDARRARQPLPADEQRLLSIYRRLPENRRNEYMTIWSGMVGLVDRDGDERGEG